MAARPAGPAPTEAALHEAALAYLARFAATQAGLVRVLDRRIARWAQRSGARDAAVIAAARAAARKVAARLVQAGIVDDAQFAQSRARGLMRSGRSRRAASAHLAAHGVDAQTRRAAVPADAETELAAAVVLARRHRVGPFGVGLSDPARRTKALGAFARAGFSQSVALRVLGMERDEAETLLARLRQA